MREPRVLKDQMLDPVSDDALRRIESRLMRSLDAQSVRAESRYSRGAVLGMSAAALSIAAALLWWSAQPPTDKAQAVQTGAQQAQAEKIDLASAHAVGAADANEAHTTAARRQPERLRLANGELLTRGAVSFKHSRVEFRGGAAIEAKSAASLRVLETSDEQTKFEVQTGRVLFDVPTGSAQTWTVVTPHLSVQAGTARFVVMRDGAQTRVVVEGGEAIINTGDGKSLRLVAGDSYTAPEAKETARFVTRPPASEQGVPQVRFEDVDHARARGDIAGAISHLQKLAKHGSVHQRSLAQFTLGKLLHEQGEVGAARDALEKAKSLAQSGPLAGAIERRLEQLEPVPARKP